MVVMLGVDAQTFQRFDIDTGDREHFIRPLDQQDIKGESLAFGVFQHAIAVTCQPASVSSFVAARMPARLASDAIRNGQGIAFHRAGQQTVGIGLQQFQTAARCGCSGVQPRIEFEKYDLMRGWVPPVTVVLISSKLKAWISASRTRQSVKICGVAC